MITVYKCTKCSIEYPAPTHDQRCARCGNLLKATQVAPPAASIVTGRALESTTALTPPAELVPVEGHVVLVCDGTDSMRETAFPKENKQLTRLQVVTSAIQDAFAHMHSLGKKDTAFVTFIAYGRRAKIMTDRQGQPFIKPVAKILEEFGEPAARQKAKNAGLQWDQLSPEQKAKLLEEVGIGAYLYDQLVNDRPDVGPTGTNITAALTLGREIADATLAGSLEHFGIPNTVSLIEQKPIWISETEKIMLPNIRCVIYTDGEHNIGELRNAFASFPPRSVLMTAFIGDRETNNKTKKGSDEMKKLANICPLHNAPGYFLVNSTLRHDYLRRLYHMATGTSGLCPSCMLDQHVRLEEPDKPYAEDAELTI